MKDVSDRVLELKKEVGSVPADQVRSDEMVICGNSLADHGLIPRAVEELANRSYEISLSFFGSNDRSAQNAFLRANNRLKGVFEKLVATVG